MMSKKKTNRDKFYQIRLTEDELNEFREFAKEKGLPLSKMIRESIRFYMYELEKLRKIRQIKEILEEIENAK
jgi:predicted DNA binding CopG/RHH family protein